MIKCIAIDDEPLALSLLKNYLQRNDQCLLVEAFTDTNEAKQYLQEHPEIRLIFLDIQMPDITGIDFYDSLSQKPMVIFTTAFSEHAVQGFELEAIDYLLKPFAYERLEKAIQKAVDHDLFLIEKTKNANNSIYVKSDYKLLRILFSDIIYIESVDDYIKIYRKDEKPVMTLMSMKSVLTKLPLSDFIRIHRRYIISLEKVTQFSARKVMLEQIELPIGERFAEQVKLVTGA